jgi:hypothetical protein
MAKKISANKQMLKMLFKEVIEQIHEEALTKLMDAHRTGENVVVVIGENSRGSGYKTAFSVFTVPHSAWKLYPEPQIEVEVVPLNINMPSGARGLN